VVKKCDIVSSNCALFKAFFVYSKLNTNQKIIYKKFLHKLVKSCITEMKNPSEFSSDNSQPTEKQPSPRVPKQDHPGRLSRDFSKHKLEKITAAGQGKKKYSVKQCKICAPNKKHNKIRYICKFHAVPLHRGSCLHMCYSVKHY
jgi:hypothetical protein